MGASVVIIIVISVLDIIALGLGIGAEQRRTSGTYQSISNEPTQWCSYTSDIATGLAAGALVFLLISQLLLAAVTRCLCRGNSLKPGAARAFAFTFCILNWISFSIAEACFLAGAVQNAKHVRYLSSTFSKEISCEAIRKDTFVAGVAFTLFTFILSISYYLCYSKAQEGFGNIRFNKVEPGVSMASYE